MYVLNMKHVFYKATTNNNNPYFYSSKKEVKLESNNVCLVSILS